MTNEVEVVNAALVLLGEKLITSIDDQVKPARVAKERFQSCRQAVLALHNWNFASKRVTLAPLTTTPAFDWTVEFKLPSDSLRLIEVMDDVPYMLEGRKILCDETAINIRYITDVVNLAEWPPLFCEALASYFALKTCYFITGSNQLKADLEKDFDIAMKKAKNVSATENHPTSLQAETWLKGRFNENADYVDQ